MEQSVQLGPWRDQEAFVLSIHGTHIRLIASHFTAKYLSHVNSPTMPTTEHLMVRRSKWYDLKLMSDRREALKLCIGIDDYLRSGDAEIALIQLIQQIFGRS
jgi:hypothetical protein